MKQHMLTHKIRDMPQHMFDKPPATTEERAPVPPPPPPPSSSEQEQQQQSQQQQEQPKEQQPSKRAPGESELPLPKRPPSKYKQLGVVVVACKYMSIKKWRKEVVKHFVLATECLYYLSLSCYVVY